MRDCEIQYICTGCSKEKSDFKIKKIQKIPEFSFKLYDIFLPALPEGGRPRERCCQEVRVHPRDRIVAQITARRGYQKRGVPSNRGSVGRERIIEREGVTGGGGGRQKSDMRRREERGVRSLSLPVKRLLLTSLGGRGGGGLAWTLNLTFLDNFLQILYMLYA